MRKQFIVKTVVEWISLGIFAFVALIAVANCKGDDWQNAEIESTKTADNGDIEAQVDKPKRSGAVWGNAKKDNVAPTKTANTAPAEPVAGLPSSKVAAKSPLPLPKKTAAKSEQSSSDSKTAAPTGEKYLLKSSRKKGSSDLVETLLEVTGTVKQVASDQKQTDNKMEVVAGFRYEERVNNFSLSGSLSSVRQYNLAKSKMKIGDRTKTPELEEKLQTIICTLDQDNVTLFSPRGTLTGEQLLLIEDLPGNTLTIDRLLPNKEVSVGQSWKISDSVLRSFVSVDAVTESNIQAVLTGVADSMAMVEVVGDVNGVYLGAATEMSVRAKYQFDLQTRRINWIGLLIEENRSIGHVGPGLDLVAKLQVKISPTDEPIALTDDVLETINIQPTSQVLKLKYSGGKGPWRFSHDRSWYVFQDDPQSTILRKLEKGDLIAQCNIADMGTVDIQTMTNIDKFQEDLIRGLGKNFGKVVAAEEQTNKAGYKVYNVILDGTVDSGTTDALQLRWIYNLLTDKNGRQSVVVFVVEADKLEQFGDADERLLETYRMGKLQ